MIQLFILKVGIKTLHCILSLTGFIVNMEMILIHTPAKLGERSKFTILTRLTSIFSGTREGLNN